ncbi:hypothetical protein IFU39_13785 [Paenibacillus sp. CFBP 13594]|uniref:hypothetical protein n=1 Tax=Paenibacillus sp. CFBP 13594 TaxID=2774037 RepID=UPI00177FBE41|nr:hypothetical protein [Paenibacillus sp. CFBP 13594]MBD8838887.1 hypothetical protein [Paenibacillus sp. CFBP 13594]
MIDASVLTISDFVKLLFWCFGAPFLISLVFSLMFWIFLRFRVISFTYGLNLMNTIIDRVVGYSIFWSLSILGLILLTMAAFWILGILTLASISFNVFVTFLLYCAIVVIPSLTYYFVMEQGFNALKKRGVLDLKDWDYVKGGKLYRWPDATYKYLKRKKWYNDFLLNTKDVASHIYKLSNVVFVSPSANKGRIEEKLYDLFPKKFDFILMDYSQNIEGKAITKSNGKFTYVDGSYDGNNLKSNLAKLGMCSSDIIMDIRGCIWYSTDKDDDTGEGVTRVFREYHKSLKVGGVIIIDAVQLKSKTITRNQIFYKGMNLVLGFQEISTYQKIQGFIDNNDFIDKHFHTEIVGEGSNRLAIFKKIS